MGNLRVGSSAVTEGRLASSEGQVGCRVEGPILVLGIDAWPGASHRWTVGWLGSGVHHDEFGLRRANREG